MAVTKKDISILVKHFKGLIEKDVVGVTSADAIDTVYSWLLDIGQVDMAQKFNNDAYNYYTSPKVQNMVTKYNKW